MHRIRASLERIASGNCLGEYWSKKEAAKALKILDEIERRITTPPPISSIRVNPVESMPGDEPAMVISIKIEPATIIPQTLPKEFIVSLFWHGGDDK